PLEERRITVARGARAVLFPAAFQLVAAMNPCPCGYLGDDARSCRCTPPLIDRYRARVSGPLLDRIDLHAEVPRVPVAAAADDAPPEEPSAGVRARVEAARARQRRRLIPLNAHIPGRDVRRLCRIGPAGRRLLEAASERLGLSARAYTRILRMVRTIADLAGEDEITPPTSPKRSSPGASTAAGSRRPTTRCDAGARAWPRAPRARAAAGRARAPPAPRGRCSRPASGRGSRAARR